MKRIFSGVVSVGLLIGLSGCSSMYSDVFDCPVGAGVSCRSISQVQGMVDTGTVGAKEEAQSVVSPEKTLPLFESGTFSAPRRRVVRHPEKTLRIWMAAHPQEEQTFKTEHYLYVVLEPGFWRETAL